RRAGPVATTRSPTAGGSTMASFSTHTAFEASDASPAGRTCHSWRTESAGRPGAETLACSAAAPAARARRRTGTDAVDRAATVTARLGPLALANATAPEGLTCSAAASGRSVRLRMASTTATSSPAIQDDPLVTSSDSGADTGTSTLVTAGDP